MGSVVETIDPVDKVLRHDHGTTLWPVADDQVDSSVLIDEGSDG